jgi:hypothetical protein
MQTTLSGQGRPDPEARLEKVLTVCILRYIFIYGCIPFFRLSARLSSGGAVRFRTEIAHLKKISKDSLIRQNFK